MALTDVEKVRLLVGDVPTSPFYMLFEDEEVEAFLDMNGGNVRLASRMAAIAASMQLAGWNTKEATGDIEVWNSLSTAYLKALDNLISDSSASLPSGLAPYASGISWVDINSNNANSDNKKQSLLQINTCGITKTGNTCADVELNLYGQC